MKRDRLVGNVYLIIASLVWGTAFVAQSIGADYLPPFTFQSFRWLIGATVLFILILIRQGFMKAGKLPPQKYFTKKTIKASIFCGVPLFVAGSLQQIGIGMTSVAKAGFITVLYIIFIPIINIFFQKKVGLKVWISVLLALIGLYFLSFSGEGISINKGDIIIFISSICFAIQILFVDKYLDVDGIVLSFGEFLVTAILSFIVAMIVEHIDMVQVLQTWKPLLYLGVFSCGIAYTFQILGQKTTDPVIAALIMSLESVISAISGWIILGEYLTKKEIFGCILIFIGIILAQIPLTFLRIRPKKRAEGL